MAQKNKYLANNLKLQELEVRLNKNPYLSKHALPGPADALIFQALTSAKKIPSKHDYFNFYHWFITMSQFAKKEVNSWKHGTSFEIDDALILEALNVIKSVSESQPTSQLEVDYLMNIIIKDPAESNIKNFKNKLDKLNLLKGKRFTFEIKKQGYQQKKKKSTELRITLCLSSSSCDKLQETILKYPEVEYVHVKRKMKEKKIQSIS